MSPRKSPDTNEAPHERSGTASSVARDSTHLPAPVHHGRAEQHATLGSGATASRGATHPDRETGGGALRDDAVRPRGTDGGIFSADFAEDDTQPGLPDGLDAGTRPSRDDVHEQRTDPQPREGVVSGTLPRRARPRSPA